MTALIAVTKLIKRNQPQMYDYLLKMRDKKLVQKLVNVDDKNLLFMRVVVMIKIRQNDRGFSANHEPKWWRDCF